MADFSGPDLFDRRLLVVVGKGGVGKTTVACLLGLIGAQRGKKTLIAEVDGAGRILIPGPLRKFAGLEKDVALVGQGARFELWDEAKWGAQMEKSSALGQDGIPPDLEGFSI